MIERMRHRVFIALGGNLGNVSETFDAALERLGQHPQIEAVQRSRSFHTAAIGDDAGQPFVNAAAKLSTTLPPLELLDELQATESALGRTRDIHWGPRTLDLDLILFGDEIIRHARLTVPHPACWYRRFVVDPMEDIAADVIHPEKGLTFRTLRERLLPRPLPVSLAGGTTEFRGEIRTRLQALFPQIRLIEFTIEADPALILSLSSQSEDDRRAGDAALFRPASPIVDLSTIDRDPVIAARYVLEAATGCVL